MCIVNEECGICRRKRRKCSRLLQDGDKVRIIFRAFRFRRVNDIRNIYGRCTCGGCIACDWVLLICICVVNDRWRNIRGNGVIRRRSGRDCVRFCRRGCVCRINTRQEACKPCCWQHLCQHYDRKQQADTSQEFFLHLFLSFSFSVRCDRLAALHRRIMHIFHSVREQNAAIAIHLI